MTTDDRITMQDVIDAGYCPSGARRWFRANDLDFAAFLRDGGIDRATFLATGCALAQKVVERKDAPNG